MADLHELLDQVEATQTVRGSIEKLIDGLTELVKGSNPALGGELVILRSAMAMAITTNTSHIAVDANSSTRIKALAAAIQQPHLVNAERIGRLEDDVVALTSERDVAAVMLSAVAKERDELREALRATQDALYAAQTQVLTVQLAHEEQVARNAASLATAQEQASTVLAVAKEAGAAAIRAAAAAEAAVKVHETVKSVEPAKE